MTPQDTIQAWRQLVNMTPRELRRFLDSPYGRAAGLTRAEASAQGIKSGRESAGWILRMKATPVSAWTPAMWAWARRQVAFIRRMSGMRGPLTKTRADGTVEPTRKLLALLVWGHDPTK